MYLPFIGIYSIRVAAHLIPGKLYRRGSGLDCKSGGFGLGWFDSITSHEINKLNQYTIKHRRYSFTMKMYTLDWEKVLSLIATDNEPLSLHKDI